MKIRSIRGENPVSSPAAMLEGSGSRRHLRCRPLARHHHHRSTVHRSGRPGRLVAADSRRGLPGFLAALACCLAGLPACPSQRRLASMPSCYLACLPACWLRNSILSIWAARDLSKFSHRFDWIFSWETRSNF